MTQQPPFSASGIAEYNFIGREAELRYLVNAMRGVQPTSQNIYGARRIGKSSLLWQFVRRWGNYMQDDAERSRFVVVHLSLLNSHYWTEVGLYAGIAQAVLPHISRFPARKRLWEQETPWTREAFGDAVKQLRAHGVLLALAWDDVEAALANTQAFDEGFFKHLRYLMNHNHLMLVAVSKQPLEVDKQHKDLSSLFFNLGQCLELEGFTAHEVNLFLGQQDASERLWLNVSAQTLVRKLAGQHPAQLQLAALKSWEAEIYNKDEAWVEREFRRKWQLNQSQRFVQFLKPLLKQHPWKVITAVLFSVVVIMMFVLILLDKAEVADLLTLLGILVPLVSP